MGMHLHVALMLQEAIDAASRRDYAHVRYIHDVITNPYADGDDGYSEPPAEGLRTVNVS